MNLSIEIYTPVTMGGKYLNTYLDEWNTYTHSIKATGGFWDASFTIADRPAEMEDWFENGLGRHVIVRGPALQIVWEGFVNKVTLNYGTVSIARGGLMDVTNICAVNYSNGSGSRATWKQNDTSVAKWGYLQKELSATNIGITEAEQIRDQYLVENADPNVEHSIDGAAKDNSITVDCLGYVNYLDHNLYDQPGPADAANNYEQWWISEKIKTCLALEKNNIFNYIELLNNPGFEILGTGGNTFASWTDVIVSDGVLAVGSPGRLTPMGDNLYCLKATKGNADTHNADVEQTFDLQGSHSYVALAWKKELGTAHTHPDFLIYDLAHPGGPNPYLLAVRNSVNSGMPWTIMCRGFVPHSHGGSHEMKFGAPDHAGQGIYWDDASVRDYPYITENVTPVSSNQTVDKTLWETIKDLVSYGATGSTRALFGVYENRTPYYYPAPDAFEYEYRATDNRHEITTTQGEGVADWDVRPGKWVKFTDFLVGKSASADIKADPRAMFIEDVQYSASDGLTINSGKLSPLQQKLYRLGIVSIGS